MDIKKEIEADFSKLIDLILESSEDKKEAFRLTLRSLIELLNMLERRNCPFEEKIDFFNDFLRVTGYPDIEAKTKIFKFSQIENFDDLTFSQVVSYATKFYINSLKFQNENKLILPEKKALRIYELFNDKKLDTNIKRYENAVNTIFNEMENDILSAGFVAYSIELRKAPHFLIFATKVLNMKGFKKKLKELMDDAFIVNAIYINDYVNKHNYTKEEKFSIGCFLHYYKDESSNGQLSFLLSNL